ncbi:hypothetical protein [Pseudalkalibacillus salsuginis]|uniref:hypothetical protein n=1 Tax=Pseudalkalibacillus salsuginis TaxID=2910972 RepID=UPI001F4735BC|nr:hypothetical protein [Pseudalkalibacillus salsuginis]MCF6408576.1 hypothetical protein [Pseudalkalibacillus salsuginis]
MSNLPVLSIFLAFSHIGCIKKIRRHVCFELIQRIKHTVQFGEHAIGIIKPLAKADLMVISDHPLKVDVEKFNRY